MLSITLIAILFVSFNLKTEKIQSSNSYSNCPASYGLKKLKVMIDAGLGGQDAGAFSKNGEMNEKDIALQISRKIKQFGD